MKLNRILEHLHQNDSELIATFGDARLVKHLNGKFELRGGTPDDRTAAREWCSLFLHEAIVNWMAAPRSIPRLPSVCQA